jgi:phage terminase large subunit-like protein
MTTFHPATRYALDAVLQKITVGRFERLACLRHLYDLARAGQLPPKVRQRVEAATEMPVPAHDPNFPWMYDGEQASFVAIEWFAHLVHVEGEFAGKPIELIPAHVFDLSMIFGWVSRAEQITRTNGRAVGVRRFNMAFITEGRKNAKTTRGAGIGLYMMIGDMEVGPSVYCTAYDKKQAGVLYNYSRRMAELSRDMRARLKIGEYRLVHRTRGGEMVAFSGEVKNKDSFNPSCAFIDEYHAHPTSKLFDLMVTAQGQRQQPLILTITTAGDDTESPCYKEYEYCRMIVEGSVSPQPGATHNEHYFVMIRQMDENDDEHDPSNWVKSNPLRCANVKGIARLKQQHDTAFDSGIQSKIRSFRVKNLNIWVHGDADNSYLGEWMAGEGAKLSKWDQMGVGRDEFQRLTADGLCLVGVDMSKRIDLTALAFVFALPDGRVAVSAHGFIPSQAVNQHEKTDKIPYRVWAEAGWLTITDGAVTDYARLEEMILLRDGRWADAGLLEAEYLARIEADYHGWHVHEICYDPYEATSFKNNMDARGYTTVEVRQIMANMNEPTKTFQELVADGKIVHDGSPLLRWCAGNARFMVNSKENMMITKKNQNDTRRIDLLAATLNAMKRYQALQSQAAVDPNDIGV